MSSRVIINSSLAVFFVVALQRPLETKNKGSFNIDSSARNFVQAFYDWYVPIALKDNPVRASDLALKEKPSYFSLRLARALRADSEAQARVQGYIVGIDFDPFLAAQDPCEQYAVGEVRREGESYFANVYGICSGERHKKPDVVAEFARRGHSWMFVDFHYPGNGPDLLGTLRLLREERARHVK